MSSTEKLRILIFLTYVTGYNIKDIYALWESGYKDGLGNYDLLVEYFSLYREGNHSILILEKLFSKADQDTDFALRYLEYQNIKAVPFFSKDYPQSLRILKDCPPILYYKGKLKKERLVAVIGTRNVSRHAERVTSKIIELLISEGFGIVSGLALGVDSIAHHKSLDNNGYTLSVLPNSLETVYPKENLKLANSILKKGGALVSELVFGINRGKKSFVERDRIQAAFAEAVIPIEMGIKSGTMHTVNFAKSQKKCLYLLKPAQIMEPLSQYEGIVHLIDQQQKNPKPNIFIIENMVDLQEKIYLLKHRPTDQFKLF